MIKRILRTSHFKFALIAVTLIVFSLFINLSAYLVTDAEEYKQRLRVATGADIGLTIDGQEIDSTKLFYPGDVIDLRPTVTNSGDIPIYVFAEIDFDGLTPTSTGEDEQDVGGLSPNWHLVKGETDVYYYGNGSTLTPMDVQGHSVLFNALSVPVETDDNDSYNPSVVAYGIQTANMDANDPATVWGFVK